MPALPEAAAWSWAALPDAIPSARRTVLAHLHRSQTPDPPLCDVGLALSEAVTNVVLHAYIGKPVGDVRVYVDIVDQEVAFTVEDDGRGLLPRIDSPGLGMGLTIIARIADRMETTSNPNGGLRLRAWFALPAPSLAADA